MKIIYILLLVIFFSCSSNDKGNLTGNSVQGWNILSNNEDLALKVIERAKSYDINHLQLSHQIIMDLRHAKNPQRAAMVNRLTEKAHNTGIENVYVWDHALYPLDYYPRKFRTGPDSLINLDNPEFWQWIKNDYRTMLDLVPDIDGVILTFIETGAHVEDQYSEVLSTEEEKLAAMVDTLASVLIDERNLDLYVRTFVYNKAELSSMIKCINMVKNPKLRVMTKEVPHDFFLTHPVAEFVNQIAFPTIIEFDAAHEYNGQGIVTSMFPEVHLERWDYYKDLPNVVGYVARTDRYNNTTIINNPAEINLYAIKEGVENESVNVDSVYHQFISKNYGRRSVDYLIPAFKKAHPIITSSFYTLGLNINSHSRLQYNDNSAYMRHVSGKWMDNPVIHIGHNVNKDFHYWKDVVNHLAPAWYKKDQGTQLARESQWVLENDWLQPVELLNETYLRDILTEKAFAVEQAAEGLELVKGAKGLVNDQKKYDTLLHVFERTLLTSKLYEATAKLYFGYRVFAQDPVSDFAENMIKEGLEETKNICLEMQEYPHKGPTGQFDWEEDIYRALAYYNAVAYRDNNEFYRGFFPYFSFGRMKKDERQQIWARAFNE